jgi:alpha-amylase
MYESWDEGAFGDMPDLSHRNPYVYAEILKLARWLIEEIGFDGFRYDFVKGYGANTVTAIQEYRYTRDGQLIKPYGVAEFWDNARAIENWVSLTNFSNSNPVDTFDFPLREALKALCDQYGYSLHNLLDAETVLRAQPQTTVTFVENHDLRDEGRPIVNDKLLAYSYILTTRAIPASSGKITSTSTSPSRIPPMASSPSCKPTKNSLAARPRCSTWTMPSTSCSAPGTKTSPA